MPLEIVKSLNGKGVKPAVNNIPSHAVNPPPVLNFSLNVSENQASFLLNYTLQKRRVNYQAVT